MAGGTDGSGGSRRFEEAWGGGGGSLPRKVVSFSAHNEWVEHWMESTATGCVPGKQHSAPTRLSRQQWAQSTGELRRWLAESGAWARSKFEARCAAAGLGSVRTDERMEAHQTLLRMLLQQTLKQLPGSVAALIEPAVRDFLELGILSLKEDVVSWWKDTVAAARGRDEEPVPACGCRDARPFDVATG